ncbi:hopanoid-associated sugar epimerase [Phenylobacterium sp.]|uniref:hopanoid-associated sugar epimerase n=1 Tax=Phenylobacterium sp. TaxID=1871053 RepID=UPI002F40DDAA
MIGQASAEPAQRDVATLLRGASVLVTGASGFVGSAVAHALQAHGAKLRVLVRRESPRANLEGLDAEVLTGDMRDASAMAEAVLGVRYLFHVAADYRLWARDPEEIVRNNLGGTRAVMEAALGAGVERVVYTSSVATLGLPPDGRPGDESLSLSAADAPGAYKRSKVVAEAMVLQMVRERGLPAVVVNPSTPLGPRDVRPTPTGRILVEAATGKIPAFVDTGLNLVHVDDVAAGHLLALARGRVGERYVLGGQDVSLRDLLALIAALAGRRPPAVKLPIGPLRPLADLAEQIGRLTGREPFLTRDALKMAEHHMYFSSAKAERALGYHARPYRDAVRDALAWFQAAGYLS